MIPRPKHLYTNFHVKSAYSSAVAWQPYPTSNFCHVVRGQYRVSNCERHGMSGYKCCMRLHETQVSIINHGRRLSPSTSSTATPGSDKATATIVWNSLPGPWMSTFIAYLRAASVLCHVVLSCHMLKCSVSILRIRDHPFFSDGFCCLFTG